MSATYQAALAQFRAASAAFRAAQDAYRSRQIGDEQFLTARAAFDAAGKIMDAAEAAEKERTP